MTIETRYYLRCNECHLRSGIPHGRKSEVRPTERDAGWRTEKRDGETVDICPRCQSVTPYKRYYS